MRKTIKLMNEIKELSKWTDIQCSGTGSLNTVQMSVLTYLIYNFHVIPIKIPARFFVNINKLILKCTCKGKSTRMAKTTLKEKKKIGSTDTTLLHDLLLSYSNQPINTVWYWSMKRQ